MWVYLLVCFTFFKLAHVPSFFPSKGHTGSVVGHGQFVLRGTGSATTGSLQVKSLTFSLPWWVLLSAITQRHMIIDLVMCSYTKTYDNWSRYVQLHKGTSVEGTVVVPEKLRAQRSTSWKHVSPSLSSHTCLPFFHQRGTQDLLLATDNLSYVALALRQLGAYR